MAHGLFITLEGGEGAGKSTQRQLLAAALEKLRHKVCVTREPGGAPSAEIIRGLLVKGDATWDHRTEVLLHVAARREHLQNTVRPALALGQIVISDRYSDSTVAYQGYGYGIDLAEIAAIHKAAQCDLKPDLTLILDIPVEAGLKRAMVRAGDENRYENMDIGFHRKLRDGFLAIAAKEPQRCKVIDATRDIEAIHTDIVAAVTPLLKSKA